MLVNYEKKHQIRIFYKYYYGKEAITLKKTSLSTVLTVVGALLTLGGSAVSAIGNDKKTKETLAELVKEELKNK